MINKYYLISLEGLIRSFFTFISTFKLSQITIIVSLPASKENTKGKKKKRSNISNRIN
jgi:hypothetical protein